MNGASSAARDDTMGCMPAMNRHVFACRSPLYLANRQYTSPRPAETDSSSTLHR